MEDEEMECPMCGEACYREGKDYPLVCTSKDCSWVEDRCWCRYHPDDDEHTEPPTPAGPVLTEQPEETMLYVHDHGDDFDPACRYEVCLTIAGERYFSTETEARAALGEVQAAIDQRAYLRGVADAEESAAAERRELVAERDALLVEVQDLRAAAGGDQQVGPLSLSWARDLLRRCAVAENRIREEFAPEEGRQPVDTGAWPADECQRWLEGWAIGNLSARRAALGLQRDLEAARTVPVAVIADGPAEVKVISGALLLKSGRVRLALSNAHAAATCEAMRALLPADSGAPHEHTERRERAAELDWAREGLRAAAAVLRDQAARAAGHDPERSRSLRLAAIVLEGETSGPMAKCTRDALAGVLASAPEPEAEHRTEPPPWYDVANDVVSDEGRVWRWDAKGPEWCHASKAEAIAACWAHYDKTRGAR